MNAPCGLRSSLYYECLCCWRGHRPGIKNGSSAGVETLLPLWCFSSFRLVLDRNTLLPTTRQEAFAAWRRGVDAPIWLARRWCAAAQHGYARQAGHALGVVSPEAVLYPRLSAVCLTGALLFLTDLLVHCLRRQWDAVVPGGLQATDSGSRYLMLLYVLPGSAKPNRRRKG